MTVGQLKELLAQASDDTEVEILEEDNNHQPRWYVPMLLLCGDGSMVLVPETCQYLKGGEFQMVVVTP